MATIALAAVGAAAGASVGGGVLGLSSVVIGRAIGATVGRMIDQRLLGSGSSPVEVGRMDRFRLTGASEGTPVSRLYGRMRLPGQVIWASNFRESVHRRGGGKMSRTPKTEEYSYSVSLAIALCEGVASGVGRIWADGQEIEPDSLSLRYYPGDEEQLADPTIEAIEGAGMAPAYRGIAYVVIEELELAPFGNRVPQFSFEVFRPQAAALPGVVADPGLAVQGVALMPGTGEYAYATRPVSFDQGAGERRVANVSTPAGRADLLQALDGLEAELPQARAVSLVVSWFGDDLRAGQCKVEPRVEQVARDGDGMPWRVSGLGRTQATQVPMQGGGPVYGGTPADAAVVEALQELKQRGLSALFYPFVLMCQQEGNGLPDPWTGSEGQPALPWRGRITSERAPGVEGSTDGTSAAAAEVAAFFGTASAGDFTVSGTEVRYQGDERSYRRFVLHYAHLCKAAGGVEAFCIGSELRGLTTIRGPGRSYPAVAALRALAAECRAILGAGVKIGYAADWSEYFGHHPQDGSGDVIFHLDPLWADENVDFVGIDNYMPLSDWRGEVGEADARWGAVHNLDYLRANVAGGEGYEWYYQGVEARAAQLRTPIVDTAYGEDWVFRPKDLRGWWENWHHDRLDGVAQEEATAWVPGMKPIWFTEIGCPAVHNGTNQPNVFWDPKSSESALPHYSNGRRDDVIQMQYLRALLSWWSEAENNPLSVEYGGAMVDLAHVYVWCWDARPFPAFPNRADLWADAANYRRGHWLNGRGGARSLASVVGEICRSAGIETFDVSELYGLVRGFAPDSTTSGRAALQPLMLAFGFDAIEQEGRLVFRSRHARPAADVARGEVVARDEGDIVLTRAPVAEISGRVRLSYVDAEGDYEIRAAEAVFPDEAGGRADGNELALALTPVEGQGIAERWLAEARIARDTVSLSLPPSRMALGAGDVLRLEGATWRIDRVERTQVQAIEATRCEPGPYEPSDAIEETARNRPFVPPLPVFPVFMDLPLLRGSEIAHAPHVAVSARPWPGAAAVWSSDRDEGYGLNLMLPQPATVGVLEGPLVGAPSGRWDRRGVLRVRTTQGTLASLPESAVLNGANLAAVGDGSPGGWEVLQFRTATLMAERTWELTGLLRGQSGSEGQTREVLPAGSLFVLLDEAVRQLGLELFERRLARHYRIGPAGRPNDDPTYVHRVEAFDGVGLRPLSPVHLRREGMRFSWIRRGRIGADSWEQEEVPLGEAEERYRVRLVREGSVVREVEVAAPWWTYGPAERAEDGLPGAVELRVAQVSQTFGPGSEAALAVEL